MKTIDSRYFTDLINISNADSKYQDNQDAMKRYSKEILKQILGDDLYLKLIDADPSDNSTDLGKLYYGTEYTDNGKTYIWGGILNETDKISILSDYAFIKYSENQWVLNGMHGTTVPVPENSELKGSYDRMVKVWERLEKQIHSMYDYMYYSGLYTDLIVKGQPTPYSFRDENTFGA